MPCTAKESPLTVTLPLPFRSSRPLLPGNPLLEGPGVVLDVVGIELGPDLRTAWQRRITRVGERLGWPRSHFTSVDGTSTSSLGFTAPYDQLQTARQANEWALCAALLERDPAHWSALRDALRAAANAGASDVDPHRPELTAEIDESAALTRLARLSIAEARAAQRD